MVQLHQRHRLTKADGGSSAHRRGRAGRRGAARPQRGRLPKPRARGSPYTSTASSMPTAPWRAVPPRPAGHGWPWRRSGSGRWRCWSDPASTRPACPARQCPTCTPSTMCILARWQVALAMMRGPRSARGLAGPGPGPGWSPRGPGRTVGELRRKRDQYHRWPAAPSIAGTRSPSIVHYGVVRSLSASTSQSRQVGGPSKRLSRRACATRRSERSGSVTARP
jgi:hypothetical protein